MLNEDPTMNSQSQASLQGYAAFIYFAHYPEAPPALPCGLKFESVTFFRINYT